MNIGFDGKRATNNITGLGNYSRSLISQLAKYFPQNQYFVYSPGIKDLPQIDHFIKKKGIRLELPKTKELFWRSFGIKSQLLKDNISLYHGLSHELPIGIHKTGIASLVTIHDLIFLRFPHYYGFIDRVIYRLKAKYACKHASKIIAISEQTKRDIIEFFQIAPNKIEVIYQSCDDVFKSPASEELKSEVRIKYNLPARYILNVGTIESRKNLLVLIRALKNVDQAYQLVVVGKKTPYFKLVEKEIQQLGLTNRVSFLQDVALTDLPAMYQMSETFVYPSIYEGFGIPIIEALYSNVPVVAAVGSCLEEAGGDASLYVGPADPTALASAINSVLSSPQLQASMKEKGMAYVQKFNNERIGQHMMEVYLETLKEHTK